MALFFVKQELHKCESNALHHLHLSPDTNPTNAYNEMSHTKGLVVGICADHEPVAQSTPLRSVIAKGMLKSELVRRFFVR